jgi:hypothetical protein
MRPTDNAKFFELVGNVYAFYRQDYSKFAGSVWLEAMKPYDFAAVADALNRHCVNPDNGQFMPKPADIVRMLEGSTQDSGMVAWSKVDTAVRQRGTYVSVVFDDPIIHRVILDMGGWVLIGGKDTDEWPFVAKEFVNRYRGYKMRSETPEYPPVLIGMAEAQNNRQGFKSGAPVLIGNAEQAKRVLSGGTEKPMLAFTQMVPTEGARLRLEATV